jgi:hypothetical protein
LDRDGQALGVDGIRKIPLAKKASGYYAEIVQVVSVGPQARHEFRKSPPGKAGFRISGALLDGHPPELNQLQQRLASVRQSLAFFKPVDEFPRLGRQFEEHLLYAGGTDALTAGLSLFDRRQWSGFGHRQTRIGN